MKNIRKFLQKIFKSFTIFIFFIFYGKINSIIKKSTNNNRIKKQQVKFSAENLYSVYTINKGRLYTDTIHDTAILLENSLIEGPSFQLRNNNNASIEENSVLKKGTPRIKRKFKGKVLSLLTGGGGNSNYWHWILDVLPRLAIINKLIDLNNIDYFLVPSHRKRFQKETLEELGIPKSKILSSESIRHFSSDQIITTDHPYVLTNDQFKDMQDIPEWILTWLKDKFNKYTLPNSKENFKKIYIDRSDTPKNHRQLRFVNNEYEIKEYLIKKGYKPVRLSDFHFIDQVALFANATDIIGLHGAGFVNLIFCRPKTKIIEFKVKTTGNVIGNLAIKNNLNYDHILGETKDLGSFAQQGNMYINLNTLKKKLNDK